MSEKQLDGSWYIKEQLDFDKKLIYYRYITIKQYFKGPYGLELGPAEGQMTKYLINDFEHLTSVDASKELLDLIPAYNNHEKVNCFFESFNPSRTFNTIIMEHVLEHVYNPVELLKQVKDWLESDGVLLIGVPNALSFHRLAAVKMGLLKSPFELNERDYKLGHQRIYSLETFINDIHIAEFKVIETGGVFFKPLSNGQIDSQWDERMQEGFYELGKDFPKNAAEIYAVCKK